MDNLGYILLADDNEDDLELETRALAQYRLANEIVLVRDGAEALAWLGRPSSRPRSPSGSSPRSGPVTTPSRRRARRGSPPPPTTAG